MKKNKYGWTVWKRLLGYIVGEHKLLFASVIVCIFLSSFVVVVSALFLEILIDDYITPLLLENAPVFTGLFWTICGMAMIYFVGVISTLVYNQLMIKISQGTLKSIRDDMFAHMEKLPIKYYDTHTHGDVMSHFTNDTDTLRQFISQALPQFVSAVVTVVVILISMIMSNVMLTILVLIVACLMGVVTKIVGGKSAKYFIKQQETLGNVSGFVEEMVNGQKVIKVFCHEEEAKHAFDKHNQSLCQDATKANAYGNILMPSIMQLGNLQYVLIALVGGYMALKGIGAISVGMIVAFLNLSKTFCMPVSQIAQQMSMMAMAIAGAERIFDLMDEEIEEDHGYVTLVHATYDKSRNYVESIDVKDPWAWKHPHHDGTTTYVPLKGDIEFCDVDFGYSEEKMVLHNIVLDATAGEKIAFVGATGAGKTTITNLINRFYNLADGKIRYDGININKIKKTDLRHSLGIVLQDVNLFTGTIMDNIRYGKLDASDEECIEASKLSNAHEFITHLPDGYQTVLTQNGASLSQGQRQLISIARAAVANPPVMILDEATSSIDTRTERLVQKGMDNLMNGRTVFVIAHRLSTIRNADAIMVLEQGRIIERGTHESLLQKHGVYHSLYTGAFELE
ncbi:ABC transporter ATP-binding protein [Amedibacillus sp. YH-ame6]